MNIELWINSALEGKDVQIDLYGDETIVIDSALQDIRQIDTTFMDFSQEFKVPATAHNNKFFKHWYDSAIYAEIRDSSGTLTGFTGFDNRDEIPATLLLDGEVFRRGVIRINSVETLRGNSLNYNLSFFGKLRSLLDKFRNDKLFDLETIDLLPYERTLDTIMPRIDEENLGTDIMYPLINSTGSWEYIPQSRVNDTDYNIGNPGGAIDIRKLYPAVSLPAIFNAIQQKYDVEFTGDFLNNERFTRAYALYAGKTDQTVNRSGIAVKWINGTGVGDLPFVYQTVPGDETAIRYTGLFSSPFDLQPPSTRMFISIEAAESTEWTIIPRLNGSRAFNNSATPLPSFKGRGSRSDMFVMADVFSNTPSNAVGVYTFDLVVSNNEVYKVSLTLEYNGFPSVIDSGEQTALNTFKLSGLAPDILVVDFLKGILNLFNLTCYSIKEDSFEIEEISVWYDKGSLIDIDPYVEKKWNVGGVPVYTRAEFTYKESKSKFNSDYRNSVSGGTEYGNLEYSNPKFLKGDNLKVNVPFENLQFRQLNFGASKGPFVSFLIDDNDKAYKPNPIILYHNGLQPSSRIYLTDGEATPFIESYNIFGQELRQGKNYYYLNWGSDVIPATGPSIADPALYNTLFRMYYQYKVEVVFDIRTRLITTRVKLPSDILNRLELNDSVLLEGELYQINKFSTDLYTGITTIELLKIENLPPVPGPIEFDCAVDGFEAKLDFKVTISDAQDIEGCVDSIIVPSTLTTIGATGVSSSGLPTGVTATYDNNIVIISGTPTVTGVFNYTITTTGGIGEASTSAALTIIARDTITSGTSQTVIINEEMTPIVLATTGATGATFSGLPPGVSGTWANDQVTISGTPNTVGDYTYTVTTTGGCPVSTSGTIFVRYPALIVSFGEITCNTLGGEGSFTSTFEGGSGTYEFTAISTTPTGALDAVNGLSGTRFSVSGTSFDWVNIPDGVWYVGVKDSAGNTNIKNITVDCPVPIVCTPFELTITT
jgi:hypothetical protein